MTSNQVRKLLENIFEGLAEELTSAAISDDRMDSATRSALHEVSSKFEQIDWEWIFGKHGPIPPV